MLTGIDVLFLERLLIGGLLAAMAVVVAFGPELRQTMVRMRRRGAPERRNLSEPSPS